MIRKAVLADLEDLKRVYRAAKAYMVRGGNPDQWPGDYPECMLAEDIEEDRLYAVCGEDGAVHAAFVFALGPDPTYAVITEGSWTSHQPYGVIHRVASDGLMKGILPLCLSYCKATIHYIRLDTHHENLTMQHQLQKCGCQRRGIIYTDNGTPRLAYEYFA